MFVLCMYVYTHTDWISDFQETKEFRIIFGGYSPFALLDQATCLHCSAILGLLALVFPILFYGSSTMSFCDGWH